MTPTPPTAPLAIPPAEAARRLGLSYSSLRRLVLQGALPVARVGRRVLIKPEDVTALLERGGAATQRNAA